MNLWRLAISTLFPYTTLFRSEYWRWMKPQTFLFPGTVNGSRADKPITPKALWEACREAAQRAGITKAVRPHLLRHSFATQDRKSTRLNSSHLVISYAVFCLKK